MFVPMFANRFCGAKRLNPKAVHRQVQGTLKLFNFSILLGELIVSDLWPLFLVKLNLANRMSFRLLIHPNPSLNPNLDSAVSL